MLTPVASPTAKRRWFKVLYVQVLIAIALGVALGHFWPAVAVEMKPFGDGFIKLIKMVIALVIFCTVVSGIAGMDDMKKVGRVGGKALLILKWSRPLPSPLASLSRTLFSLGRD